MPYSQKFRKKPKKNIFLVFLEQKNYSILMKFGAKVDNKVQNKF